MFGVFALACALLLRTDASIAKSKQHEGTAAIPLGRPTLVTHHKTGTLLVQKVHDSCFPGLGIDFEYRGNLRLPAVHLIRDPRALIRSAYDYHKRSSESWLHDRQQEQPLLQQDRVIKQFIARNETYQEFLRRVPFDIGIRAEFLRSAKVLERMIDNSHHCRDNPACKEVCLEQFTMSSASFRETWMAVLRFLGLGHRYLPCIENFDLLNPHHVVGIDMHATSPPAREVALSYEIFGKLDEELMHGAFSKAELIWGCAPPVTLRTTRLMANNVQAETMADRYS